MDKQADLLNAYVEADFHFVRIPMQQGKPTKAPTAKGWNLPRTPDNPNGYTADTTSAAAWLQAGENLGLALVPSGVVSLDIDNVEETRRVLAGLGLPLDEWLADPGRVEIQSGKANKGKLLFRLDDEPPPPSKKLAFGRGKDAKSIFELRHGSSEGRTLQDVLPPSIHPDTGKSYRLVGDVRQMPTIPPELLALWRAWPETLKSFDPAYQPPTEKARKTGKPKQGERDAIAEFNEAHELGDLLERHGYRRKGKRYLRPGSESGIPGVTLFEREGRKLCYSHGSDALNDGHAHDAFDVFRLLECGGEWKQALGWNPEITRHNNKVWAGSLNGNRDNRRQSGAGASRRTGGKPGVEMETVEFTPPEYPVKALGPLADTCHAIADGGQMNPAMAGQCVLSVAALLTQSRANVRTLAGIKPLSCYFLTIGESGDGKTTAEEAGLHSVKQHQRRKTRLHRDQLEEWEQQSARCKKMDAKPDKPRLPDIITQDGTVEGIRRGFAEGMPSQGVFSSEAAAMLCGYGMNADNRSKSAGAFNKLWDDGEISVSRGTSGRLQLYDRRFSLHWLIQPDAAKQALHDPLLANIGFWPRFLVAWPAPGEPRIARPFKPEEDSRIKAFWERCEQLLAEPQGEDCGHLRVLDMTPEAYVFVGKFFERMEQAAKLKGGQMESIKPFALRATEQLCRVAGVVAEFGGATEINLGTVRNAALLVEYSLETWRGIFGCREEAEAQAWASLLLEWLKKQPEGRASETAMLKVGPKKIRSKAKRDTALALLDLAGQAERSFDYWSVRVD